MLAEGEDRMVTEMSDKEVLRSQVMAQLVEGKLDQATAALRLGIGVRQVKRLKRAYTSDGAKGLVSGKRGRPSNRRTRPELLEQAMSLVAARYGDFGPTLAAEKLAELHEIKLAVETVRQAMLRAGLWKARKGAGARTHPMRERRARRGELIQIDGSPHDWFEGRSARCSLLVFIDDATGELMALRFVDTETTLGYMGVLQEYILEHGLPAALYSDRHSIFRINSGDKKHADEQTQFGRALQQLGIESIHANSPQAKGRVERANQTLQDRLVKEMRLQGIDNQSAANVWLPQFIRAFNRRFAVQASLQGDAHVRFVGQHAALRRILAVHTPRRLSNNLSCQHAGLLYQIQSADRGLALRGTSVNVVQHVDGMIELLWQDRLLPHVASSKPEKQAPACDGKDVNGKVDQALTRRAQPKPIGHPWKRPMATPPNQAPVYAQFHYPKDNLRGPLG